MSIQSITSAVLPDSVHYKIGTHVIGSHVPSGTKVSLITEATYHEVDYLVVWVTRDDSLHSKVQWLRVPLAYYEVEFHTG